MTRRHRMQLNVLRTQHCYSLVPAHGNCEQDEGGHIPGRQCVGASATVQRTSRIFPRRRGSTRVRLEKSIHRFLSRNRAQKRAYYEEGKHGTQMRQSAHPAKFRHLLRVTEATSRFPERDTLILLLGVTCGKRITEIARVEVHHVLSRRGTRQEEISLPGQVTKGCRPRCVFLSHPRTIEAFDCYVD